MTTATDAATLSRAGIATTASAAAAAAKANPGSSPTTLGQADFLRLMTAQLKNQDPFSPVDNTQMIAQMAQFSSVAGIGQMNTTLSAIAAKLGATSASDAMGYVGRSVLTEGNTAYARTSGGIAGSVELGDDASDVDVTIADASGNVLKTVSLGAQKAGTASYDWDGVTDAGEQAGAGPFTLTVRAAKDGANVASRSLVWAPVSSVSLPPGGEPTLSLPGLGDVKLSAVRSVA